MQPNSAPNNQQPTPPSPQSSPATPPVLANPVVTMAPDTAQPPQPVNPALAAPNNPSPQPVETVKPIDDTLVRWRATEYIHREKNPLWFVGFFVVTFVFMVIALFIVKDISFGVLVPVMAAALIVYTRRPPRVLDYTLSRQGLHVNDHLYPFAEFKGFGVIHDDDEYSVMLLPTKRFKPGVSVYFPEESGEAIVDMLGARLPMKELKLDLVDRLIRKLRI